MNAFPDSPATQSLAVSFRGVSKKYRHFQLKAIDLAIAPGSVHGLIGPNGAGKSTSMRIMMGMIHPDQGTVRVLGQPISSRDAAVKQDIGYFAEDMRLYKQETLGWHMQFVRSMFPSWDDDYARQLIDRFGLIEAQRVKGISHGQRVKAMLLLILARRPRLLILDEPTNGLDPVAKQEVLTELMRVVEDDRRTILYSSHNTRDIEQICDTITFIDRGRVIASDNRDSFLEQWQRVRLQVPEGWQVPDWPGLRLESAFGNLRVAVTNQYRSGLSEKLQATGAEVEASEALTLEEIFVATVARGREESRS